MLIFPSIGIDSLQFNDLKNWFHFNSLVILNLIQFDFILIDFFSINFWTFMFLFLFQSKKLHSIWLIDIQIQITQFSSFFVVVVFLYFLVFFLFILLIIVLLMDKKNHNFYKTIMGYFSQFFVYFLKVFNNKNFFKFLKFNKNFILYWLI